MVEIFEKCLVLGISFILASAFYPLQYNLSFNIGRQLVKEQYSLLADEIDSSIKKAYSTSQEVTLNILLPKQLSISRDGGNVKMGMDGDYIHVGSYDFDVIIEDKREHGEMVVIEITRHMNYVMLVMRDAERDN